MFLPALLLPRLQAKEPGGANTLSCVELLSIFLCQADREVAVGCAEEFERAGGMAVLVKAIARYRRVESRVQSMEEKELQESLFDVLCQLLRLSPPTQSHHSFAACDGVLALLAILQRQTGARFAALKALDHATQHQPDNIRTAIEAGGIKLLFALLTHSLSKRHRAQQADMEEHTLAILVHCLLYSADTHLARLLHKFTVSSQRPSRNEAGTAQTLLACSW